ncbi:MAG: alpha/beta hydrolase [Rhizobiaceae bacterium]
MSHTSQTFNVNGQTIHAKISGDKDAPVMLFLHGFPESWVAWAKVAEHFADDYRVVLPDQRGFNLSSKPAELEAYDAKHLVADMVALIDQVSPDKPIILCGHDWGASVAYALAMRHADRVSHLIIANGVHPMCFQKALFDGGAQAAASQYMNVVRAEGSEEMLSANNFEKLLGMFEKFSSAPWLTDKLRDEYRAAWAGDGTLSAMLNWYRGSPMVVPPKGAPAQDFPITDKMRARFHIPMPHLVLWGMDDTALLPAAREDLPKFCADLAVFETENASHWILHEKPDWVAQHMIEFLS